MALSDYERRVLDEIESEFTHAPRRRWARIRQCLWAVRWALLLTAGVVGLVVGLSYVLVAVAALAVAAVCGAVAGFALGSSWRRYRGWLRGN